jgi:hypothetical protein
MGDWEACCGYCSDGPTRLPKKKSLNFTALGGVAVAEISREKHGVDIAESSHLVKDSKWQVVEQIKTQKTIFFQF